MVALDKAVQIKRESRQIDGFLLLDKQIGVTSNSALQTIKRLYRAQRAGHTGTLDPMASGLMIVCFGNATRFAGELLNAPKSYVAELTLGQTTTTGDSEGSVLKVSPINCDRDKVEAVLCKFRGSLLQTPPMHSALKHLGVPLYKLAREGLDVYREPRPVTIYSLKLESMQLPVLKISVNCSKGTYIRVLAEEIGTELGCGAYLSSLTRTALGQHAIDDARSGECLAALTEAERDRLLHATDRLISVLPSISLLDSLGRQFCNGQVIEVSAVQGLGEHRVYDESGIFLGTGTVDAQCHLNPSRVVFKYPSTIVK